MSKRKIIRRFAAFTALMLMLNAAAMAAEPAPAAPAPAKFISLQKVREARVVHKPIPDHMRYLPSRQAGVRNAASPYLPAKYELPSAGRSPEAGKTASDMTEDQARQIISLFTAAD